MSQRQRNDIGDSSSETIKQFYAGSRIVGVVKRVKRIINNELNPLYREDKIPSSELNVIHLLYAIRYACASCICFKLCMCFNVTKNHSTLIQGIHSTIQTPSFGWLGSIKHPNFLKNLHESPFNIDILFSFII